IGRCGDIVGVWIDPVTAQVMMTLLPLAIGVSSLVRLILSLPREAGEGGDARESGRRRVGALITRRCVSAEPHPAARRRARPPSPLGGGISFFTPSPAPAAPRRA